MMRYLKAVDARIPKVTPDFDPQAYKQMEAYENACLTGRSRTAPLGG